MNLNVMILLNLISKYKVKLYLTPIGVSYIKLIEKLYQVSQGGSQSTKKVHSIFVTES